MAQYYQVTSLEELHNLYPNLQLENVEGVQCMIQDDQLTDIQGQQIITTVDPSNIQLSQNVLSSPQCKPPQTISSQYVVQQPTQYVIQQIDSAETQAENIQYMQQNNQQIQNQVETNIQFSNQQMECTSNVSQTDHTINPHLIKSDDSKQFVAQVQPMIQQPLQIQQQLQTVEMGTNILVLQNHDQDLVVSPQKVESVMHSQSENQHIVIQRQQQAKSQSLNAQIQQEVVQTNDNASQQFVQQSIQTSQGGGHLQPVINNSEQPIIQPLQYYNQVTVIDGFSSSNATVEHSGSKNLGQQITSSVHQQQPSQPQQQQPSPQNVQLQFKSRKIISPAGVTTVFQGHQQVVIPQQFEMSSPPPLNTRFSQYRKKVIQQPETSPTTPVFIVQKLDSPLVIRQPQAKVRFQSPTLIGTSANENVFQTTSSPLTKNITQISEEAVQTKPQTPRQMMSQEKIQSGIPNQGSKSTLAKSGNITPVKLEIIEHHQASLVTRQVENVNKASVSSPALIRAPAMAAVTKIKTVEQQTEPIVSSNGKEGGNSQFEKLGNNLQCQSTILPQMHTQAARGRGVRGSIQASPVRSQNSTRGRGVHIQASPPNHPTESNVIIRGTRPVRGPGKGARGGWVPSSSNQRPTLIRTETPHVVQRIVQNDGNTVSKEAVEETRVLVLLLNGEKKLIRIPSSQQNIFLGQILQQAGLTVTTPTSVAVEQVIDISNSDQTAVKTSNQPASNLSGTPVKTPAGIQSASLSKSGDGACDIAGAIQTQPRSQPPKLQVSIQRNHFELTPTKVATSASVQTIVPASNIHIVNSQTQTSQNLGSPQQPVKEESRFISGYMAICPFCGIQSLDFNKCIRCRRKLPENVKAKPIFNELRMKLEKATAENEKASDGERSEKEEKQSDSSCDIKENSLLQLSDKKKIRSCVKKKKIADEPTEILILSSDDEEDNKLKKTELIKPSFTVLRKEPVYIPIELSDKETINMIKECSLNEDLMKNAQPGLFTTLQCRTIRFGSYKAQPKDRIMISNKGIRLVIGTIKNETTVIVIPLNDILKVLLHFGKQIPVIFIYPQPKIGVQIRSILKMDNKLGPYYDPASSNEIHKRITLLLEKVSEENKITLQKIFAQDKLEELSEKEANEILLRSSPPDVHGITLGRTLDGVRKILVYPPPPEKGGITLNNQDYACLGEDQFLNDVIIDFYLKYLMQSILSPEDRNRTHVFSTFFYKRLTTKPKTLRKNDPENDPTLSPAEKRHLRVKGWTKHVNLFEKDFIIVPINEHSHWFLAIICFPGLTGPVRFSDNTPVEPEEVTLRKNSESVQIGNTTITHIIKTDGNTISLELDSGFDRDEAEGDQDDLQPSSSDEDNEQTRELGESVNTPQVQIPLLAPVSQAPENDKDEKVKAVKRKVFKEPIKQPCILIFDSLAGASRVRVVATLRDYMKIEYKTKMGQEREFSKDTIKGAVPRVPQQNNFTDCGLYVLQYVESFFQDPLHDFKLPLKYLQEWFPEEVVSCKRQKLAALIRSLMEEQGINVDEIGLPILTFTNGNVPENQMPIEDEEEEEEEMNVEDEEMVKHQVQISEFSNEDEDEDMDLGGEEEEEEEGMMDDNDDDEEDEEEEDEEELEVGEIPRQWLARTRTTFRNEIDNAVGKEGCGHIKSLVEYEESESEEEEGEYHSHPSNRLNSSSEMVEGDYCDSDQSSTTATTKSNVPVTELQEDFESQISCTTIDKNMDCKNNHEPTDMVISDDDDCESAMDEGETSFETSPADQNSVDVHSGVIESATVKVEKTNSSGLKDTVLIEGKKMEVTDIIKKLVCDKNITISRGEDVLNTDSLKKHLEMKRLKVKDCDNSQERNLESSSSSLPSSTSLGTASGATATCLNSATQKRTFQALKSVRIPKKTDRSALDVSGSKRQKVDKT